MLWRCDLSDLCWLRVQHDLRLPCQLLLRHVFAAKTAESSPAIATLAVSLVCLCLMRINSFAVCWALFRVLCWALGGA